MHIIQPEKLWHTCPAVECVYYHVCSHKHLLQLIQLSPIWIHLYSKLYHHQCISLYIISAKECYCISNQIALEYQRHPAWDAKNKTLEDWHSVNSWQPLSWKYSINVVSLSIRFVVTTNVQSLMLQWLLEHCYSICTTGMLITRTQCLTTDKSALLSGAIGPTASAYVISGTPTGLYTV